MTPRNCGSVEAVLLRAALAALLLLTGCAADETAGAIAARHRLAERQVPGDGFTQLVYESAGSGVEPDVLDIYLEGDGIPWSAPDHVAADPTPRRALALELMAADPGPSLYLGRPCYFGHAADPGCGKALWTDRRYGTEVLRSLAVIIARERAGRRIRLIGYSGGGALAALLAARVPGVVGLVTIAADLDVAAWARWHGYTPLTGSLDPADEPLPAVAAQHLIGDRDEEVPQASAARYLDRLPPAEIRHFADFDHRCCWAAVWPEVIRDVRAGR